MDDLAGIFDYLNGVAGRQVAMAFLVELNTRIEWIAQSGTTGIARDHIRRGLRGLIFKDRCIYFRVVDDECRIERVLHTRQDVSGKSFAADKPKRS